jgi:uncharacterized protein (TIGR02001 family)
MRVKGLLLLLVAWPAPAAALDISGELGAVSDYRYRGVSLSGDHPAVQGSITVEHESGLYGELWTSTLGRTDPANIELDFTGGYEKDLSKHLSFDLSATSYVYPHAASDNYVEGTAKATANFGAASTSLGVSFAPAQRGTRDDIGRRRDNTYVFAEGALDLPKTPVTLNAHLGYERGAFDNVERGGKWDWSFGGEVKLKPMKLGLSYVGSNADGGDRRALVASAFVEW